MIWAGGKLSTSQGSQTAIAQCRSNKAPPTPPKPPRTFCFIHAEKYTSSQTYEAAPVHQPACWPLFGDLAATWLPPFRPSMAGGVRAPRRLFTGLCSRRRKRWTEQRKMDGGQRRGPVHRRRGGQSERKSERRLAAIGSDDRREILGDKMRKRAMERQLPHQTPPGRGLLRR